MTNKARNKSNIFDDRTGPDDQDGQAILTT